MERWRKELTQQRLFAAVGDFVRFRYDELEGEAVGTAGIWGSSALNRLGRGWILNI